MFVSIRFAQHIALRSVAAVLFSIVSSNALAWTPALSISGTPAISVTAGYGYAFQPSAYSRYGRTLTFSVTGKPSWASFSSSTGRLGGIPQVADVGRSPSIVISVSDGRKKVSLPAFVITVKSPVVALPPPPANTAPVISGTPSTQVMSGNAYSFRPTASDANGDALTFSVTNLPSWASFSASTGTLSGAPSAAHVGTYSNVQISVSDGKGGSASLPAFSVAVLQSSNGAATLSWTAPLQNTDGSTLTNLAGYKVSYGATRGGPYANSVTISNPSVSTYLVENLTAGTYYFVVTARTSTGVESTFSNEASKTIN